MCESTSKETHNIIIRFRLIARAIVFSLRLTQCLINEHRYRFLWHAYCWVSNEEILQLLAQYHVKETDNEKKVILYCIVLYLRIYKAPLAVQSNRRLFQCEESREKRKALRQREVTAMGHLFIGFLWCVVIRLHKIINTKYNYCSAY